MTPEQQNTATALACGWRKLDSEEGIGCLWRPTAGTHIIFSVSNPPNYSGDLNACAEMRKALEPHERDAFTKLLMGQGSWWDCIDAPAARQCEAFLRVKGLWK